MYCPNCGKGEQAPDTYCRSCGEYSVDFSDKFYLINRVLGISTPEQQVRVNLTIDLLTSIASALLLIFLIGYFDGRHARTGESAPTIIYLVYLFLSLVSVWQFLSFIIDLNLKSKLSGKKEGTAPVHLSVDESTLSSGTVQKSLPQAGADYIVPASVTEDTTKILDQVPRK
jgi:hypothetical protein